MTFKDIFPELSRTLSFNFQDFPGPEIFKNKKPRTFAQMQARSNTKIQCQTKVTSAFCNSIAVINNLLIRETAAQSVHNISNVIPIYIVSKKLIHFRIAPTILAQYQQILVHIIVI